MTIAYTTSPLHGGFFTLLFRWQGSIWKHIWRKLFVFCFFYSLISIIYRCVLNDEQQKIFGGVSKYFDNSTKRLPLSFILGFFVAQVVRRWYDQYTQITKPDRFIMFVSGVLQDGDQIKLTIIRRTLARHCNLACILVWRKIALRTKKRFPKDSHLISCGLMTAAEKKEIDTVKCPYSSHNIPLMWMINLVAQCKKDGHIDSVQQDRLLFEINTIRGQLGQLSRYEWIQIPLIYTQVATLATYGYFVFCTIGRQFIKGDGTDLYIPVYTLLEFVFYMGWLQVAEDIFNPFGEDEEDFEMSYMVDKNVQNGFTLADTLCDRLGSVEKDKFWDTEVIKLAHTRASCKVKEHSFKSHLDSYRLSEVDMELVDPAMAQVEQPELTVRERIKRFEICPVKIKSKEPANSVLIESRQLEDGTERV